MIGAASAGIETDFDGDFERDDLLIEGSRMGPVLKVEVDCLDLSAPRELVDETRSTWDTEDRNRGISCKVDPKGRGGLALEFEFGPKEASDHCRCEFEADPDGLVCIGIGGEGLPVAVDFQDVFPGDCTRFRDPMEGRERDPTEDTPGLEFGGTAEAAEGEDPAATECHC